MWSNSVSKEELKLLDILSDSMINLNYGELCSMMTDQHSITAEAINKLKQLLLSGELKLSPQDPAPIVVSDKVQGVASEEARNEQEKQPEQNFMVAQSRISSEKRKLSNKEVASKTRKQKKVEYAALRAKMHMLRQDNQKLREAAISRLPRSPNVVSLLNNSFQIPFDVLALMRDYTADIQSDDTSSVASRARSESTNTGVDAIGAPAVSFGTSMEENISFCILDSTSIDLRIKYASICYRTISAYQPLVGCSFRDLPGPASNLPQFATLRDALNNGRAATVHVVHYAADGNQRTMMVSLVFTSVPYTAPVPFIIALQIGRAEAHKPVLPLTVGSSQSLTAFGSSMVPGASRSASTKAGPSNKRRNDTSLKGVKAVKAAKNGTASGRTKTSFGPVHIASSSADASMHVVEGVGLDQHSCSSSSSVSCSSCDSFSSSTCLTDSDSAGLGVGMDNGLTVRMADYAPLSAISPLGALFCGGGAAHPQIQAMRASAQAPVPYISGRMLAEFLLGPEVWEDVSYDTGSCGVSASLAAFYRSAAAVNNDANPAHPHSHPFFQSQPVGLIHPVVPVPQMLLPVHLAGPSTPTFPTVTAVSGPDKDVFAPRASVNVLPGPQHQPPLLGCECDSLSLQTTYLRHPAEGGVQQHQAHPEPPPRPQSPPGMCLIQNLFKH